MLVAGFAVTGILETPVLAAERHTWTVTAGSVGFTAGVFDGRRGNAFYPGRIAAHPGDQVTFTFRSPHTVVFNRDRNLSVVDLFAPSGEALLKDRAQMVNSGFNPAAFRPGSAYTLRLDASLPPGRYPYICALHFLMQGVIDVLPNSEALPKTDQEYAAEASRQATSDLATASEAAQDARDFAEDHPRTVLAGAGTKRVANLRFYPSTITVHVGESIAFLKTKDPTEPHTVTFGEEPANQFVPVGGPPFVWDGTHPVSTGALTTKREYAFAVGAKLGIPRPVTSAVITFARAGEYVYICTIHDRAAMQAKVVVLP
jgi:plastocyanin